MSVIGCAGPLSDAAREASSWIIIQKEGDGFFHQGNSSFSMSLASKISFHFLETEGFLS